MKNLSVFFRFYIFFAFFSIGFGSFEKSLFAQSARPILTEVSTTLISSARVRISWVLPTAELDEDSQIVAILIFKSTQPFANRMQLEASEPIAILLPTENSFVDVLKNFREQYYAVIAETRTGRYDVILPSVNATVNAVRAQRVEIPQNPENVKSEEQKLLEFGQKRETPLPYLDLLPDQKEIPLEFSKEAQIAASKLLKGYETKKNTILEPHIFDEDLIAPTSGDEYFLFEILKKTFAQKKFQEAQIELEKLLSVKRSKQVFSRAQFYLGESCYFCKDYGNAVKYFLIVENDFPALTRRWIESALDLYKIE